MQLNNQTIAELNEKIEILCKSSKSAKFEMMKLNSKVEEAKASTLFFKNDSESNLESVNASFSNPLKNEMSILCNSIIQNQRPSQIEHFKPSQILLFFNEENSPESQKCL